LGLEDPLFNEHREAALRSADAMGLILHTVSCHDIVLVQATRRRINAKLPRGGALHQVVEKVWKELTGKALSKTIANKLVNYFTAREMCVWIGKL
jgi:hypothetical protein